MYRKREPKRNNYTIINYICKSQAKFRSTITCLIIAGKGWKLHAWIMEHALCSAQVLRHHQSSLKTMLLFMWKRKPWDMVPQVPSLQPQEPWWCHSVSLGLALPAHSADITQHGSSVARADLRPQRSWNEGKNNFAVIATSQTAVMVCNYYLKASNVIKVLLEVRSFPCTQVKWQVPSALKQLALWSYADGHRSFFQGH